MARSSSKFSKDHALAVRTISPESKQMMVVRQLGTTPKRVEQANARQDIFHRKAK
jgi:hypothetical protein